MNHRAWLQANIGQMDAFLAEIPARRVLERIGFGEFAEELAAFEAVADALFGWLP